MKNFFLWLIVCLMTMVVSVNAQEIEFKKYSHFAGGKYCVKMTHGELTFGKEKAIAFEPNYTIEGTILSKNGIEPIIKFLETVLAKAQNWNEICSQSDVNRISKTIDLKDGVKFSFKYGYDYGFDEITVYEYDDKNHIHVYLECSVNKLAEIISELKNVDIDSLIIENDKKEQRYKELYDKLI